MSEQQLSEQQKKVYDFMRLMAIEQEPLPTNGVIAECLGFNAAYQVRNFTRLLVKLGLVNFEYRNSIRSVIFPDGKRTPWPKKGDKRRLLIPARDRAKNESLVTTILRARERLGMTAPVEVTEGGLRSAVKLTANPDAPGVRT